MTEGCAAGEEAGHAAVVPRLPGNLKMGAVRTQALEKSTFGIQHTGAGG